MHLNRNKKDISTNCKSVTENDLFFYKILLFLLSFLLSGRLREGQWRFPTEETWRTPSVTCWAAYAPPARMWAPPSSKSWAEEPPSSASPNSPARCSLRGTCTCPHTFTQVPWCALYVYNAEFKRAKGGWLWYIGEEDAHPHRRFHMIAQPVSLRISAVRMLVVSCRLWLK